MTGAALLRRHVRRLRLLQLARYGSYALPLAVLAGFLVRRFAGGGFVEVMLLGIGVALIQVAAIDWANARRRVTRRRVTEHLDRRFAALEDSAALLLSPPRTLSLPARLQRERTGSVLERLQAEGRLDEGVARRLPATAAVALVVSALLANLTWLLPQWFEPPPRASVNEPIRIAAATLEALPPGYTRLEPMRSDGRDVRVPEFSTLRATLRVAGPARSLAIRFGDNASVRLYDGGGGVWQTPWWPATATTWQVERADGAAVPFADGRSVGTIALTDDRPPEIRIDTPDARLHEIDALPFDLPVALEVTDDHGVAGITVHATRATGTGERVSFDSVTERLYDDADARRERVDAGTTFAADALGLEPGAEVYLHFEARDARPDAANVARSQTLILRWRDPDAAPEVVLDNAVVQVMPEYFRSQRQIIIDSEALVAERGSIGEDAFAQRAQTLAIDQKALRLRYGRFLGEEVGGEPSALPTSGEHFPGDGHDHGEHDGHGADGESADGAAAHADPGVDGAGHHEGDGHDHAEEPTSLGPEAPAFGDAMAAIAPYAHFHDQAEQATLFEPETRELLRGALRAMWRSEGALRQFQPDTALPHQYEALALIKRVQNRSRTFVARVGFEPTPVDPGRRLTGALDDIPEQGALAPRPSEAADDALREAIDLLLYAERRPSGDTAPTVREWIGRVAAQARGAGDDATAAAALDARSALDEWQLDHGCGACRDRLAGFWRDHAPHRRAPAARPDAPLDAFAGNGDAT